MLPAIRSLRRSPGFAAAAILTLGLGIGLTTAIFSVANAVLLRALPFHDADRVVSIGTISLTGQWQGRSPVSAAHYVSLRDETRSLSGIAAVRPSNQTLTGRGDAAPVTVGQVSAGFFDLLGSEMALGRSFLPEENDVAAAPVAVLSHTLWQTAFGGATDVLGTPVALDGTVRTIVGVAPPRLPGVFDADVWVPIEYGPFFAPGVNRVALTLDVIGRLAPGIHLEEARREAVALAARLDEEFPPITNTSFEIVPLHDALVGGLRAPLLTLLGAVGLLLLIACSNVANLLLAQATTRVREVAIRTALGASRWQIVRLVLAESLVLGLLGGAVGLLLAHGLTHGLPAFAPADIPRLDEVAIDPRVVLFATALSLATALLFGALPARWLAGRHGLVQRIHAGGRSASPARDHHRLGSGLVIGEIALAFALLFGAALLIRSYVELLRTDPGFRPERLVAFDLRPPPDRYADPVTVGALYSEVLGRLEALPGTEAAAVTNIVPMTSRWANTSFTIDGDESIPPAERSILQVRVVSPDYFRTMGIPLSRGRPFAADDRLGAPPVAILNETAVRRYFAGSDPIGRSVQLGICSESRCAGGEVVGVVGDVRQLDPADEHRPEIYLPHAQWHESEMTVVLRSREGAPSPLRDLRGAVAGVDSELALRDVRTLEAAIGESIAVPRFYTLLLGVFSGAALLLAGVGIYGIMAFRVAQRRREIGIRVALGADPRRVRGMVLRNSLRLAFAGLALGAGGGWLLSRLIGALLAGTSGMDPMVFLAAAAVLLGVAALAAYLPARAAMRVDPAIAMRAE